MSSRSPYDIAAIVAIGRGHDGVLTFLVKISGRRMVATSFFYNDDIKGF